MQFQNLKNKYSNLDNEAFEIYIKLEEDFKREYTTYLNNKEIYKIRNLADSLQPSFDELGAKIAGIPVGIFGLTFVLREKTYMISCTPQEDGYVDYEIGELLSSNMKYVLPIE